MPCVQDAIDFMEGWAPISLAESWDNPGFMLGDRRQELSGIMTTLDVTPEALQAAKEHHCNLLISHHPFIFKGLKSLDVKTPLGQMIAFAIKHDIAIYSAHTNLDIANGGLNDMLAQRLGLKDIKGLVKEGAKRVYKLTTYVPLEAAEQVRRALGDGGAGLLGNYSHCSFSAEGEGRFKACLGANPYIGEEGTMTCVKEVQIQCLVDESHLASVLTVMRANHPYEEVAYEVIPLHQPIHYHYLGRIGHLPRAMTLSQFVDYLQALLPHSRLRLAGKSCESIQTVALCSGGGAEFISTAKAKGADVYVTGDVKYHDAQKAKELSLLCVDAGHFGTEEIVAQGLQERLQGWIEDQGWSLPVLVNEGQEDFFFSL